MYKNNPNQMNKKKGKWIWHSMAGHVHFQVNIEVHCPTAIWSYWKRQGEKRRKITV